MPFGPFPPADREDQPGQPDRATVPGYCIASGRRAAAYLRRLKRHPAENLHSVPQGPETGTDAADLIWVPEHDRLRGDNVLVTPTSPHKFSAGKLLSCAAEGYRRSTDLPHPRVAVLVGGDSRHHSFTRMTSCGFWTDCETWPNRTGHAFSDHSFAPDAASCLSTALPALRKAAPLLGRVGAESVGLFWQRPTPSLPRPIRQT
jgi:hypothetical protein